MPPCSRQKAIACSGSSQGEKAPGGLPCLRREKRSSSAAATVSPSTTRAAAGSWKTALRPRTTLIPPGPHREALLLKRRRSEAQPERPVTPLTPLVGLLTRKASGNYEHGQGPPHDPANRPPGRAAAAPLNARSGGRRCRPRAHGRQVRRDVDADELHVPVVQL